MTKPRKTATFTFDTRGWQNLYKHIAQQLDSEQLDKDLYELHLTGSKVKTKCDALYFAKTMSMFSSIKTIVLKNMGLGNVDVLGQLLCTRFLRTKILDISGNNLSKDTINAFIDALQGRSILKDVPPIWLAIGELPDLFTKNFACCPTDIVQYF